MGAFLEIARFEVRLSLRRVSVWVYFTLFFWISFFMMLALAGAFPDADFGHDRLLANSPLALGELAAGVGVLLVPVAAAITGHAALRDFEAGSHPLFFTAPVPRWAYLLGRYAGAMAVMAIITLSVPLGLLAGTIELFVVEERIGPFRASAFVDPLLLLVGPNLLFTGALFFALAVLTRRMLANYAGGILLLLAYALARQFVTELDVRWATVAADAFGGALVDDAVKYWTVWERNTFPFPVTRELLLNRALWLAVGAVALGAALARFRFVQVARETGGRGELEPGLLPAPVRAADLPRADALPGPRTRVAQCLAVARRSFGEVVGNVYFPVMVVACLVLVYAASRRIGEAWGTTTYPVTYQVLELVGGAFGFFLFIIIVFYAGELVWRERELRADGVVDALPVPDWVLYAGKTLALWGVVAAMLALAMVSGMAVQASHGYWKWEPGLYLTELFVIQLPGYLLLVVLTMLVHVLANHKYLGIVLLLVYYVAAAVVGVLADHYLFSPFGSVPGTPYSDMNGYGHTLGPWVWFQLYWWGWAALLALASLLLWVRGRETGLEGRLRLAGLRARIPVLGAGMLALSLTAALAGFVWYNTEVLNHRPSQDESQRVQAEYEKMYKRFEDRPQPRIAAARVWVDVFPETREAAMRGVYQLVNRTAEPIDTLHVDVLNSLRVRELAPGRPAERVIQDSVRGYHAWRLEEPLLPGDSMELRFEVAHETQGFTHDPELYPVVGNGTFIHGDLMPGIGYNPQGELWDEGAREEHDLPPRPRAAALDDTAAHRRNLIARDADWMRFEATVSTSPDQVAVAPGYLQREWTEGGRRHFHYRMDAPILNFYSFLSARYAVRRDTWEGVNIEIFHHPGHEYNLDRMVRSVQRSLAYFSENFAPYQHRQVRILEFPRYAAFAQSFANTIPYSEAIGFIAKVDEDDVDYPFFVTAHEVAHQWWGHQVVGADVQGAAMLSETLAEYSALMVMEKEYGRARMEKFLRYEMDQYLRSRGGERRGEMPLALVEGQAYIHYHKGGVAMYALRDYIGEARVNAALAAFLREWRFAGPPYPTTRHLIANLRAHTPDSLKYVVEDLFETVTLWELSTEQATYRALPDGRYEVEMLVDAAKLRADSLGYEEEIPMRDAIDVGVYTAGREEPVYLRKHRIVPGRQRVRVQVDERPSRAGIDPQHKLIDRVIADNVVEVRESGSGGEVGGRISSGPRGRRSSESRLP